MTYPCVREVYNKKGDSLFKKLGDFYDKIIYYLRRSNYIIHGSTKAAQMLFLHCTDLLSCVTHRRIGVACVSAPQRVRYIRL